jgi:hypothetical protein
MRLKMRINRVVWAAVLSAIMISLLRMAIAKPTRLMVLLLALCNVVLLRDSSAAASASRARSTEVLLLRLALRVVLMVRLLIRLQIGLQLLMLMLIEVLQILRLMLRNWWGMLVRKLLVVKCIVLQTARVRNSVSSVPRRLSPGVTHLRQRPRAMAIEMNAAVMRETSVVAARREPPAAPTAVSATARSIRACH